MPKEKILTAKQSGVFTFFLADPIIFSKKQQLTKQTAKEVLLGEESMIVKN